MDASFYLVQALNSVQYGLLLFLVAGGLTLVFGIMGVINLAHGSFYMIGAYLAYWLTGVTGNLFLAILLGIPVALVVGFVVERLAIRYLYERDHLCQVLLTYGLILVFNELQSILWGNDIHGVAIPEVLAGSIRLTENQDYPVYRLFVSVLCLLLAAGMYGLFRKTRLGMRIRASAVDREMAQVLAIDVNKLCAGVFTAGVALAAFSGMMAAPIHAVYPGMGEHILITSFVVVVIGGIGSIKGAFLGAMLVGLADTLGAVLSPELAGVAVYGLMALVLLRRPRGLFGAGA